MLYARGKVRHWIPQFGAVRLGAHLLLFAASAAGVNAPVSDSNLSMPVTTVKTWLDASLNFFYPPTCQICGSRRASAAEGYVCSDCWTRDGGIRFIRPPYCERCGLPYEGDLTTPFECGNCRDVELFFRSARSSVAARGVVLETIHRYKYQRALWFEPFLADLLVREAAPALAGERWDLIVPVPLHPLRQREREFNQAERLAGHLAVRTGVPVQSGLLRRIRSTGTQTQLSRVERAANMRQAFALRSSQNLNGQKVVLLDDVFTTGATTNECARVLRQAGAEDVCVWTLARGI
jgi:competence protein ComFC